MKMIKNFELYPIGIGTWEMGSKKDLTTGEIRADNSHDFEYKEAVHYSLELGQNHIDTAELYGQGHTEELVGEVIKGWDRGKLFIASKLWNTHYHRDDIQPAIEGMLKRLGTSYLDLLYIHTPQTQVPMKEYLAGVDEAVERGLIRSIGVSNFNLEQLKQAVSLARHPIVAVQNRYSVLYRSEVTPELLEYCRAKSMVLVAYRPVERGEVINNTTITTIANNHSASHAQVALAWLIQQESVVAIPKASKKEHIKENVKAVNIVLDEEELRQLDGIGI